MIEQVEFKEIELNQLQPADYNPRKELKPEDEEYQKLKKSIIEFGYVEPIIFNKQTGFVVGGHQRLTVLKDLGYEKALCVLVDLNEAQEKALNVALNKISGEWDYDKLQDLLQELQTLDIDIDLTGFSQEELDVMFEATEGNDYDEYEKEQLEKETHQTLQERFLMPPFSVLDTRRGEWQKRKKMWQSLGIQSHLGRGNGEDFTKQGLLLAVSSQPPEVYEHKNKIEAEVGRKLSWDEYTKKHPEMIRQSGTSVFDPVLTEICYRWFGKKGGSILDPFAGGSVRGVVAGFLDYDYTGIDLREEQVAANQEQAKQITMQKKPTWIEGNSQDLLDLTKGQPDYDLVFSCPPYYDLEVYSDSELDISNADTYEEFIEVYKDIIEKAVSRLKENRFAVFVVTEIRDKKGFYRKFVADTIQAFEQAGAKFYNDIILLNTAGSLAIRVNRQFTKGRKVGRTHQNVLVFYKGDPKIISEEIGLFEMSEAELANFIETDLEEETQTEYGEEM